MNFAATCAGLEARGRASSPELVEPALGRIEPALGRIGQHVAREHSFTERVQLAGSMAWLKGGWLRGHARRRHALRRALLRADLPRLAEFENLRWLRARLFRAPEPLVAGELAPSAFGVRGPALFQFLITAEVPDATPLAERWPALGEAARADAMAELGREVARLHSLGFVHRDLYVRNLLWTPPVAGRSLVFLDAWRGGAHRLGRPPAYDLACLTLQGEHVFARHELALCFATYLAERRAQDPRGRALPSPASLERALLRERARLVRQIERDPARARGPAPSPDWRPPLGE